MGSTIVDHPFASCTTTWSTSTRYLIQYDMYQFNMTHYMIEYVRVNMSVKHNMSFSVISTTSWIQQLWCRLHFFVWSQHFVGNIGFHRSCLIKSSTAWTPRRRSQATMALVNIASTTLANIPQMPKITMAQLGLLSRAVNMSQVINPNNLNVEEFNNSM